MILKPNITMKILIGFFLTTMTTLLWAQNPVIEATSNSVSIDVRNQPVIVAKNEPDMEITLETLGITKLPKYYALIIGVSEYKNAGAGLPNLEMPTKDADRLYQLLTQKYAFDPEYVTLLKNATREDIINSFDRLANDVSDKDNVLVFYAGHGFYDKGKDFGFWLPSDAKINSRSAWIANSTIKDYIGAINSKHTLLITDACFGGSIFKTRAVADVMRRFNEMYRDQSRKAITSGNLSEVPDKSVFLHFLLKQLEDNTDVFLSSSTLFTRIYEPILDNAVSTPQFGVIQGAGDEGGDFFFIKRK